MPYVPYPELRLHPVGDLYGPEQVRLPEFQMPAEIDKTGQEHPMRIVGRHLICDIHQHPLAQSMVISDAGKASCALRAKNYNDLFRARAPRSTLSATGISWIQALMYKDSSKASETAIVMATIIKVIRKYTQASYATVAGLLAVYPEFYQDPTWLSEHQALGVSAEMLAVAKHFDIPEIIPLAKIHPVNWKVLHERLTNHPYPNMTPAELVKRLNAPQPPLVWWPLLASGASWESFLADTSYRFHQQAAVNHPPNKQLADRMRQDDPTLSDSEVFTLLPPWIESICIDALGDLLDKHLDQSSVAIFNWQRAGWPPKQILEEVNRVLSSDANAWIASAPPLAAPWQDSLDRELAESWSDGTTPPSFFKRIEELAAPDNWWQNITLEKSADEPTASISI